MRITLYYKKSLEENASMYFEKAKKAKKKIEGAKKALEQSKKKLTEIKEIIIEKKKKKPKRKQEWYEKFRWFITSEELLCIAGRDATSNEIVIKKHTDKQDLVFHSDIAGSPFGVLKGKPTEKSLNEASQFIASYSRAWKTGITITDVFYVKPDQVTKEVPSGEYISKGSFMIYGKKSYLRPELKLFIGKMKDGKIMSGPEEAVKKHCDKYVEVIQGNEKTSSIAKKIKSILDADDLDELIRVIPPGSKLAS